MLSHTEIFKSLSLRTLFTAGLGLSVITAAGCTTAGVMGPGETLQQGYVLDEESLELVPPGSSREQVLLTLGTPSTTATFEEDEVFYYISQTRVRPVAFANPRVVDQRVLAVYFNNEGRVENIANYGMQEGRLFDFISRTTPVASKDQNFIVQMISGLSTGGTRPGLGGG